MSNPLVLVVGAGPGVGGSVARRFAREGYDVALVGRGRDLEELGAALEADGVHTGWADVDATDEAALSAAVERFVAHSGRVDVLHFNPSAFRQADPLHLSAAELLADVALGVGALLTAVRAARPAMTAGARITVTGSSAADTPSAAAASLGVQKAGVRNLVLSLDQSLREEGIRAVSVTVDGLLAPHDPSSPFHPDRVADAVHAAATQDEEFWSAHLYHPGR